MIYAIFKYKNKITRDLFGIFKSDRRHLIELCQRETQQKTTNTKYRWILIQKFYFRLTVCVWHSLDCCLSFCFTSSSRKRNTIAVCVSTRFGNAKRKQLFSAPIMHTNTSCVRMTSTQHKQHCVFVPVFRFKLLVSLNERCASCIDLDTFVIRLIKLQFNR